MRNEMNAASRDRLNRCKNLLASSPQVDRNKTPPKCRCCLYIISLISATGNAFTQAVLMGRAAILPSEKGR